MAEPLPAKATELPAPQLSAPRSILISAILSGLTRLIPVPIVDDVVRNYFKRNLTRALAKKRGKSLSPADVKILSDEDIGFMQGLSLRMVTYPMRWVFRKVFIFLEWKRATDIIALTYYQGILIDHALERGYLQDVKKTRREIDKVLSKLSTSPVETAVQKAFSQSELALGKTISALSKFIRRLSPNPSQEQVEQAINSADPEDRREVDVVANKLQSVIATIPAGHFDQVRKSLDDAMNQATTPIS